MKAWIGETFDPKSVKVEELAGAVAALAKDMGSQTVSQAQIGQGDLLAIIEAAVQEIGPRCMAAKTGLCLRISLPPWTTECHPRPVSRWGSTGWRWSLPAPIASSKFSGCPMRARAEPPISLP
jgi:hypothetical protein